nr:DNA-processing protein DprA [Marinicella sp. W31]MDC2875968.1 DNA-processing protein DprA [Marinicella sp. W31]
MIAGCALAVVVVEAAMRSGSLITARLANECGRLVLAVPGSPLDPRAQGCNGLIKQGAMIVCSPEDVLEALAPLANMELPCPAMPVRKQNRREGCLSNPVKTTVSALPRRWDQAHAKPTT